MEDSFGGASSASWKISSYRLAINFQLMPFRPSLLTTLEHFIPRSGCLPLSSMGADSSPVLPNPAGCRMWAIARCAITGAVVYVDGAGEEQQGQGNGQTESFTSEHFTRWQQLWWVGFERLRVTGESVFILRWILRHRHQDGRRSVNLIKHLL